MKLALVVPGGVDRSGVDRVVPALLWQIERLARRHTVHVFALAQEPLPALWSLLGATVHNIGTVPGKRRRFLRSFAMEHARAPFDVIHAFWSGAGAYAAAASIRHRIPFALHLAGGELVALHDIDYGERRTLRGRVRLWTTLAIADHVSVASGYMQQLTAPLHVDAELIPLGVALDSWPARAPRERDTASSTRRTARLLHIGDLRPVKDQSLLLHAAARLRDRAFDFQLDIAGFDTMNGATQALATQLGLSDRVRWLGVLRRDALRAVVEDADVLLVTSRHDAGPLAFLEAAIAGVPTVGTAVGHIADWAPDGAVCVDSRDATKFADAVAQLLCDEPRRLAIAREAQRRALAIDADFTTSRFEAMYDALRRPHRVLSIRTQPA